MDALDYAALSRLMWDGRVSWSDLGADLGLAATSAAERVRKLEREGVITGYAALVDPVALGADLTAFVSISLDATQARAGFLEAARGMDEVAEIHHVAGEDDYLLKVRCAGTRGLEWLVSDGLKALPGVARTKTLVVLSTVKESAVVPLPLGLGTAER
ncbi:MAG: Lrp/AsnC family transcriptional regulator [Actinomycetota bacterium]|nr:Lrp/AsnC family transcriptional regulator [Actinomycetota bacterium]